MADVQLYIVGTGSMPAGIDIPANKSIDPGFERPMPKNTDSGFYVRPQVIYTAVKVTDDEMKKLKEIDGKLHELEKKNHNHGFLEIKDNKFAGFLPEYIDLMKEKAGILKGKQLVEHKASEGTFKAGEVVKVVDGNWVSQNRALSPYANINIKFSKQIK